METNSRNGWGGPLQWPLTSKSAACPSRPAHISGPTKSSASSAKAVRLRSRACFASYGEIASAYAAKRPLRDHAIARLECSRAEAG